MVRIAGALPAETGETVMHTLGALLLLSLVLGAVVAVIDSVLGLIGVSDTIKKLPIIGAHWSLIIAILMAFVMKQDLISKWGIDLTDEWMRHVATGAIIYGMVPLKDAIISMVNKGLRA